MPGRYKKTHAQTSLKPTCEQAESPKQADDRALRKPLIELTKLPSSFDKEEKSDPSFQTFFFAAVSFYMYVLLPYDDGPIGPSPPWGVEARLGSNPL